MSFEGEQKLRHHYTMAASGDIQIYSIESIRPQDSIVVINIDTNTKLDPTNGEPYGTCIDHWYRSEPRKYLLQILLSAK